MSVGKREYTTTTNAAAALRLASLTEEISLERPAVAAAAPVIERVKASHSFGWGKLLLGLLVIPAFAAGWMLATRNADNRGKEVLPAENSAAGRDPAAVFVTVEPITFRPVQRAIEGVGTLHGFEEVSISAKVEGRVRKIRFDVADRVKPGELLLEIDPIDHQLSLQQAERALEVELAKLGLTELPGADIDLSNIPLVMQAQSRMDNAQSRHERVKRLAGSRTISADEVDTAASDFRAAQAECANQVLIAKASLATIAMKQTACTIAKQQLRDTQVRSPTPTVAVPGAASGAVYVVTERAVAEGTLVRPGAEICKLVINQTLKLRVPAPERHTVNVRLGQTAEVMTGAFPHPFTGTVTRINPAVDPTTRAFEVEIQIPNANGELKPGSFAKAAINTGADESVATVPLSAVVNFAGINKIFLNENGRAKELHVTLGTQTGEWVEIVTPTLPQDGQVVTSGQTVLATDSPLSIRAATKQAPSQVSVNDR